MSIKSMPIWKWALLLAASFILTVILYGLAQLVTGVVSVPWVLCIVSVAVSCVMLTLYALFVKWFEGRNARDIPGQKLLKDTSKGFAFGAFFFCGLVCVMMVFGVYRIIGIGTDNPAEVVSAFFTYIVTAVGEEIIFRGVLFRWIDEKWGFAAALIVSAIFFGAVHFPQGTWWSSLAIAIEAGLFLGAAYKWSGTLWFPIGIHWAWNFFQGNIFGFAVSGGDSGASLLQARISGPEILTGGAFGAEASIIAVILGAAISIWFISYSSPLRTPDRTGGPGR